MSDIAVHSESTEGMSSFIEDKTLLMRQEDKKGNNLYFHFKECLKYLFAHQKSDAFISFEHISQKMKSVKIYSNYEEPPTDNPALLSTARIQQKLFTKAEGEEEEPVIEENTEHPFPNVMESAYQLELAGIGLSACETMNLALAIKQLVSSIPVKTARFWGKVFGTLQNMYVVEVEFEEGEDMDEDEEDSEGQNDADEEEVANEVDDDDAETDYAGSEFSLIGRSPSPPSDSLARDVLPKNKWKPPIKAPKEPNNQIGVNQKAYFVCHEPGLKWIRLPPVTPQQIVAARSICTLFTGNLDNTVNCSPAFPGTEAHYLRAQIARISSSTHISPEGYFQLGQGGEEEEEQMEDEEGNPSQMCSKNPDYESIPAEQLVTGGLEQWVHHIPYILPQGRVTWWNPSRTSGEEMEDVMEDEDEDEGGDQSKPPPPRPERGPPILSKIASDLAIFGQPAWSVRLSSQLIPEHASVVVSSNLWPGAHAVAWGKSFENVYIGWGLKASGPGFQSHLPVDPLDEFQDTPEISETLDPTPEDEAALRAAHNMENVEEEHGEDNGSDADRADEEQEED